jgi:hypothetical protein
MRTLRPRRILVVALTVVVTGLVAAVPAQAGAWEETLLDPPPARVESGVTYTFGYWILQHGSYPFMGGDLGPTALRATDQTGAVVDFAGVKSPTAGHYSAEVVFPHDGVWTIGSQHEVIMPDTNVATVTVPGSVTITPSDMKERAPYEWGSVRPSFPPAADGASMGAPQAPPLVGAQKVAPRSHETTSAGSLPVWVVIVAGAVTLGLVLGLALGLVRRYRRSNG